MWQEVLDIYRLMTLILVAIGMYLLLRNRFRYASYYNDQELSSIRAKFFLALAPLVGLTWNLAVHASFNLGLPIVTVGAIFLIYSALEKPERLQAAEEYLDLQERREHPNS